MILRISQHFIDLHDIMYVKFGESTAQITLVRGRCEREITLTGDDAEYLLNILSGVHTITIQELRNQIPKELIAE